jgi:hypothetical protein
MLDERYIAREIESYRVKPEVQEQPEQPMQLAMGGGGRGQKAPGFVEAIGVAGKGIADMGAAAIKGNVQAWGGTPGDIEMLVNGIKEVVKRGGDESMIDAFVRGMEEETILPTTESVKKFLDEKFPLPDAGASSYETLGEFSAPGGQIKLIKKAAKAVKKSIPAASAVMSGASVPAAASTVMSGASKDTRNK